MNDNNMLATRLLDILRQETPLPDVLLQMIAEMNFCIYSTSERMVYLPHAKVFEANGLVMPILPQTSPRSLVHALRCSPTKRGWLRTWTKVTRSRVVEMFIDWLNSLYVLPSPKTSGVYVARGGMAIFIPASDVTALLEELLLLCSFANGAKSRV